MNSISCSNATGSRVASDSFDSANGVAAAQNQVGGGNTFYRSQNGEVAAEKEKTPVLGDAPLVGRWFASSAMAPAAAPAPSSAPFSAINGFIDDTIATDSGPKNMGEDNKRLPQSGGGTEGQAEGQREGGAHRAERLVRDRVESKQAEARP